MPISDPALSRSLQRSGFDAHDGTDEDRFDGVQPEVIVRPRTTEEVSAVLRAAADRGAVVAVRGNGTKQTWGCPPRRLDLLVDLSRMNRILEHQPGDLIVTAQAGCTLADVNAVVAQSGQRLAIDEMVPHTTLGGLIATNVSGPRRLYAGTTRDLMIGTTLVRADGVVAHSGGKVVKNVAGYDLGKLLTGSYGTLGVITEATFRLHPVPQSSRWVSVTVPPERVAPTLKAAVASQLAPAAVECWTQGAAAHVAMLLEGTAAGVARRVATATDLLGAGATPVDHLDWPFHFPFATGGDQVGLKATCALSAVADVLSVCRELGWEARGSAGAGVLYVGVPQQDSPEEGLQKLRERARGGAVVILDGPADVRRSADIWGPVNGLAVMHRIKDEFDPGHRLAPGRFVGGI